VRERGDLAKYAVERGLARQVLAAVGKRRDDELRRRVAELGLIDHFQHALPLGARESLRGLGLRPATLVSGVAIAPPLHGARIEADLAARSRSPRAGVHRFLDEGQGLVALAHHVSSPSSPQRATAFFESADLDI